MLAVGLMKIIWGSYNVIQYFRGLYLALVLVLYTVLVRRRRSQKVLK